MQESYIKNFPGNTRVLDVNLQKISLGGGRKLMSSQDDIFIRGKTMGGIGDSSKVLLFEAEIDACSKLLF